VATLNSAFAMAKSVSSLAIVSDVSACIWARSCRSLSSSRSRLLLLLARGGVNGSTLSEDEVRSKVDSNCAFEAERCGTLGCRALGVGRSKLGGLGISEDLRDERFCA
jgi:hypothetical protein